MRHNIEDIWEAEGSLRLDCHTYLAMYILLEKDSDFEISENMKEQCELNKIGLEGQIPGT